MQLEGRSFPEALRSLAERAGVQLEELDETENAELKRKRQRMDRLYRALDLAAGFYRDAVKTDSGVAALRELESRGVSEEIAATFRLGYAPDEWDALASYFRDHDVEAEDAEAVGLCLPRRERGYFDRFRHRLMFPVSDVAGRVVGFSGRALPDPKTANADQAVAKYMNSPETEVFRKGELLFGLFEGRVATRRDGNLILVEGNFDVVALHQAGFANAAAPLGTAFTPKQAQLAKRFADRVIVMFDGDDAGRKATRGALAPLSEVGVATSAVRLPPGEDPDSFIRTKGVDSMKALIDSAPGLIETIIDDVAAGSKRDAASRAKAIESLGPVVYATKDPIEGTLYIERVARKFEIQDVNAVRRQLIQGHRKAKSSSSSRGSSDDAGGRERGGDNRAEASQSAAVERSASGNRDSGVAFPEVETTFVGAMLDNPALLRSPLASHAPDLLTNPELQAIVRAAAETIGSNDVLDAATLLEKVPDGMGRRWLEVRLTLEIFSAEAAIRATDDSSRILARHKIEKVLPQMMEDALSAMRGGDNDRGLAIIQERDRLFRSLNDVVRAAAGTGP